MKQMNNDICIANSEIIQNHSAFKYVKATPTIDFDNQDNKDKIVKVYDDSLFGVQYKKDSDLIYQYYFGSVQSYAIKHCEDPIKAIERAKSLGHKLYWVNRSSVCISNTKSDQITVPVLELEQVVKFEGRYFKLVPTWNDNIHLEEVTL